MFLVSQVTVCVQYSCDIYIAFIALTELVCTIYAVTLPGGSDRNAHIG